MPRYPATVLSQHGAISTFSCGVADGLFGQLRQAAINLIGL
jgi:hypothetical protein